MEGRLFFCIFLVFTADFQNVRGSPEDILPGDPSAPEVDRADPNDPSSGMANNNQGLLSNGNGDNNQGLISAQGNGENNQGLLSAHGNGENNQGLISAQGGGENNQGLLSIDGNGENSQGLLSAQENQEISQGSVSAHGDDKNSQDLSLEPKSLSNASPPDMDKDNFPEQNPPQDIEGYMTHTLSAEAVADNGNVATDKDKKTKPFERALTVGDTFTPPELLPVVRKLMQKVENPGNGKGIISSAKSAEVLADKLYESFFLTNKRIVVLNENDVSGLDALQALALSGEPADRRNSFRIATEAYDQATINYNGQTISVNMEPKKSKYLLIKKVDNLRIRKKIAVRRGGSALAKKLGKKRSLVVKTGRKNIYHKGKVHGMDPKKKSKQNVVRTHLHRMRSLKSKSNRGPINYQESIETKPSQSKCHWMYECSSPADLDSCRLKTTCNKKIEFYGIPHQEDEHTFPLKQFRRMIGIELVDEEVEKILERRFMAIPNRPRHGDEVVRVESLSLYFNRLIAAEDLEKHATTPITQKPRPLPEAEGPQRDDQGDRPAAGFGEGMPLSSEGEVVPKSDKGSDGQHQYVNNQDQRRNEKPTRSTTVKSPVERKNMKFLNKKF